MEFVESLQKLLYTPQSLTLLMAPPAWGKTSILLKLRESWNGHIVYISPLKALANEFALRASKEGKVFSPKTRKELREGRANFSKKSKGILIISAEVLSEDFFYFAKTELKNVTFIFDEIHLFFHWGKSFRPWLEELLFLAINSNTSILGLSATLEKEYLKRIKSDFLLGLGKIFLIDVGNGNLITKPQNIINYRLRSKKALFKRISNEIIFKNEHDKTILVFCKYRREVEFWLRWSKRNNVRALGCLGGEVDHFQDQLRANESVDVIFATTVLSHGVNLPCISKIFITYSIGRRDFWIQMVGRGGRNGEAFDLFHKEKTSTLKELVIYTLFSIVDDINFIMKTRFSIKRFIFW
jgi:superfamily II DNA or RNA helicase